MLSNFQHFFRRIKKRFHTKQPDRPIAPNHTQNPYSNVAGIDDPSLFIGRQTDLEILLPALLESKPRCYSVVGQRKIGKTSLVQHLMRPSTILRQGFSPDQHLFVYFNCQKYPDALINRNTFYDGMLSLTYSVVDKSPRNVFIDRVGLAMYQRPQDRWERLLSDLEIHGLRLVFIFDEFEKAITKQELLKEGTFGTLRAYAQDSKNFAWVTCTRFLLHDLFEQAFDEFNIPEFQRKSESNFYNIAPVHLVGLFDKDTDVEDLLSFALRYGSKPFAPEEREAILRIGGRFPFFLQRTCYHFFNAHRRNSPNLQAIVQQSIKDVEIIWEDYWGKLSVEQRKLLLSVILDQPLENSDQYDLFGLEEAALIYNTAIKPLPFSEEFGKFVYRKLDKNLKLRGGIPAKDEVREDMPSQVSPEQFTGINNLKKITILFMGANPSDTTRLNLAKEERTIDEYLRRSEFGSRFQIHQAWAVRVNDIQDALMRYKPDIVHFSGHGSGAGEILVETDSGAVHAIQPQALEALFGIAGINRNIKCVVLNACFSLIQAEAIKNQIDSVIGMETSIADEAAIWFASSFYQALGYGKDISTAFDLGKSAIQLNQKPGSNEYLKPKLLLKSGVNATDTMFL